MMNRRDVLSLLGETRFRSFLCFIFLIASAALFSTVAGCSGGGGSHSGSSSTSTAPTNLAYPQATITATAGQAISADTPTVTGTVTSYSVNSALPAGLSLSSTTGAITGTPTAATAQATYTITATNSAGTTTATVQITVAAAVVAPSGLSYPQTTIAAAVGQAIATDTPTVTGTVTLYSVSPALPAGLGISASTGAISGTPTAVTAQATYTVTATNGAGTTTATVQIKVTVPGPTSLTYPETTITTSVGQTVASDMPIVTGGIVVYTVSPALPAGIVLNNITGAISGVPTAISPTATYTITAANGGGSVMATVAITVNKGLPMLLDVGHANQISTLRVSATRVLSQDTSNHWALWDYTTNTKIISGDQVIPTPVQGQTLPTSWPVDMAGQVIAIGQSNGVDIRSASNGQMMFELQSSEVDSLQGRTWWKLATDGSYICTGSKNVLSVWSNTGQLILTAQGDYSAANAFATPTEVLVALGPVGPNVIQTITLANKTASTGPAFNGTFNSWFVDGQNFLTNTGNTVWAYSAAGVTTGPVSLPTVENLTGQGNWVWTYPSLTSGGPLNIYPIGSNAASASFPLDIDTTVVPSGSTIGVLPFGPAAASVIDLPATVTTSPTKTDFTLPVANDQAYAATSAAQWIVGNKHGVVLDGPSSTTTPKYFGTGAAWSIAGSTTYAAVATASGKIYFYSPSSITSTPLGAISFSSSKVALSSNGTVLVAQANTTDAQYEIDRSLNVYTLPSGTLTYQFPYQFAAGTPNLFDFSLSGSGTVIGEILGSQTTLSSPWVYTRQAVPTTGGAAIWSDTPPDANDEVNLSPDGSLIAVSSGPANTFSTTNIIKNGLLVTAFNGFAVGWIDNNQLLVNNYQVSHPSTSVFAGCSIYDATGALQPGCSLPELLHIQPVSSSSVYSPALNTIYSVPAGTPTYTSGFPVTGAAAVAGSNVVFASGSRIVVDTY